MPGGIDDTILNPYAGRTGRGVRVAVIDSGVNPAHPHIATVAGGVCVDDDGRVEEGGFLDTLGHGTAVMAAIQDKAPDAEYFAVRLFHRSLRASSEALFRSLEWAIAQRMHLINLSLGVQNPAHAERLRAISEEAARQGVLLISAKSAGSTKYYPGCLPDVLGVCLDPELDRASCRCDGETVYASGHPRPIPGLPQERNLNGISFAVANATGFVARISEAGGPLASAGVLQKLAPQKKLTFPKNSGY